MPTNAQLSELINQCSWAYVTENGMTGWRVSGKKEGYKDRSIFIPNAGFKRDSDWYYHDSYSNERTSLGGSYWSANTGADNNFAYTLSWHLNYGSGERYLLGGNEWHPFRDYGVAAQRYYGRTVRAVAVEKATRP